MRAVTDDGTQRLASRLVPGAPGAGGGHAHRTYGARKAAVSYGGRRGVAAPAGHPGRRDAGSDPAPAWSDAPPTNALTPAGGAPSVGPGSVAVDRRRTLLV
ncbi:hypothetical protein Shyhy01_01350 [Streptomyces hygroscopicus subsp. hygroscopicus]|nr:hypothetical protein Shyhy01_01350 [Streptomyces hygroscopicus subsp. hygroscopicus]